MTEGHTAGHRYARPAVRLHAGPVRDQRVGRHEPLVARASRRAVEEAPRRVDAAGAAKQHRLVQVGAAIPGSDEFGSSGAPVLDQRVTTTISDRSWTLRREALPHARRETQHHRGTRGRRGQAQRERADVRRRRAVAARLRWATSKHRRSGSRAMRRTSGTRRPRGPRTRGLRWESIRTDSTSIGAPVHNDRHRARAARARQSGASTNTRATSCA